MSSQTCLITGASRGIGLATALRFARGGYRILAVARGEEELRKAVEQIRAAGSECKYVVADVGVAGAAGRIVGVAIEHFGRIDALVNNAGYAPLAPLEQFDPADFERAMAVNIAGVFHLTQAVWPIMHQQQAGVIVNVSSLASVDPFPGFGVYGACKAWVNLFTKALADEGRPLGIRVFAVAPGAVETRMLRERFPDFPARQTLDPDEVARVIEAVCDERLRHSSGQTIFVRK